MKNKIFFGALAALGMLTACSSEEPVVQDQNDGGTESYVSFSIASSNASGSRAGTSTDTNDTPTFEEAKNDEAKINNVVLLFYDTDGNAINVNMGSTNTNYKVIIPTEDDLKGATEPVTGQDKVNNVENWFQKTVSLTTPNSISEARVLAIVNANINKDGVLCNNENSPVSGSISKVSFFDSAFPGSYTSSDATFVMTSSVYVDTSDKGKVISDVPVNIYDTEAKAIESPATIYVERVKARAKVIASTENSVIDVNGLYTVDLSDVTELPDEVKNKGYRIKVVGWDLNTTAKRAYLFKHLDSSYGYSFKWNDPALHRSYWESPYNHTESNNYNSSFTPATIVSTPGSGFKYCNPNTTNLTTKVLVYTQLVEKNGDTEKPADIALWYGNYYTLDDLKTAIIASCPKKVYVAVSGEENKYVTIDKNYVDFKQGKGTPTTDMDKSWMAYPILKTKLNDSDTDIVYYKKTENSGTGGTTIVNFEQVTTAEAMQLIGFQNSDGSNKLQGAKIWKDGHAYYFVDVRHLGELNAMVRNHSYTIRIDGFAGLGTPIFNPEEVIPEPTYPEDDKKSYVSVKMNVLSWRIIPVQGVIFGPKPKAQN